MTNEIGDGCVDYVPYCDPGFSLDSNNICQRCPFGHYTNHKVTTIGSEVGDCIQCPAYTYLNNNECIPCEAGKYQMSDSLREGCSTCPDDTLILQENGFGLSWTDCQPCPEHSFIEENTDGSRVCRSCAAGKYTKNDGEVITCEACPTGKYSDSESSTECKVCSSGRFQDLTGQTTCKECPDGKFSTDGSFECTEITVCLEDQYYVVQGDKTRDNVCGNCTCVHGTCNLQNGKCVEGSCTEESNTHGENCDICEPGFGGGFSDNLCHACSDTEYNEGDVRIDQPCVQKSCPLGYGISDNVTNNECAQCLPGKFSDSSRSGRCALCPAGFFSNENSWNLDYIDEGIFDPIFRHFIDERNNTSLYPAFATCVPCMNGWYTQYAEMGRTDCDACPAGKIILPAEDEVPRVTGNSDFAVEFAQNYQLWTSWQNHL